MESPNDKRLKIGKETGKEFWMRDESCTVCYKCESRFSFYNRKHHCRVCGLIFCGKCATYTVPSPDDPNGDRERVCNFCFKLRGQQVAGADNGLPTSLPVLSPSLSTLSLASTSSGNSTTSSTTASAPNSTECYRRASYGSGMSPQQSMRTGSERQDSLILEKGIESIMGVRGPTPNQSGYCTNRSLLLI